MNSYEWTNLTEFWSDSNTIDTVARKPCFFTALAETGGAGAPAKRWKAASTSASVTSAPGWSAALCSLRNFTSSHQEHRKNGKEKSCNRIWQRFQVQDIHTGTGYRNRSLVVVRVSPRLSAADVKTRRLQRSPGALHIRLPTYLIFNEPIISILVHCRIVDTKFGNVFFARRGWSDKSKSKVKLRIRFVLKKKTTFSN